MKSFCGVQGQFFQKAPLAVGDKGEITCLVDLVTSRRFYEERLWSTG
jgi:hypothetical protein